MTQAITLPRVNLILLLLVLALAALIWRDLEHAKQEPLPVLTDWQAEDVVSIRARMPGQTEWHLERQGGKGNGKWLMIKPRQGQVSAQQVDALLGILSAPYRSSFSTDELTEEQRQQMGLDQFAARPGMTLIGADGVSTLQMVFGELESQTNHRYLMVGERVYLIFDRFSYRLGMPPEQWLMDSGKTE